MNDAIDFIWVSLDGQKTWKPAQLGPEPWSVRVVGERARFGYAGVWFGTQIIAPDQFNAPTPREAKV